MRCPSATSLLNAWEIGCSQPLSERSLRLLESAFPGQSREELARLPIGERDARLLALRESVFGPRLKSVVTCPACTETLELSVNVSDLRVPREGDATEPLTLRSGDYEIRFRLPNTEDLIAVELCPDEASGRRLLLERCLLDARCGEDALQLDHAPEELVANMVEGMGRADPQAHVELQLTCPECQHQWQSPFDIASYLWTETEQWAQWTLREVGALAAAYGWSEAEILALSTRRRQLYLGLSGR